MSYVYHFILKFHTFCPDMSYGSYVLSRNVSQFPVFRLTPLFFYHHCYLLLLLLYYHTCFGAQNFGRWTFGQWINRQYGQLGSADIWAVRNQKVTGNLGSELDFCKKAIKNQSNQKLNRITINYLFYFASIRIYFSFF